MPSIPNLFVIGAMKSGTTSLCEYLGSHPNIFMSPVKEPCHFSREKSYAKGSEKYLQLFEQASGQSYLAEGSTEYTKRPFYDGVAIRLFEFNPAAKIVYLVRDPFARLISHYKHMTRTGRESKTITEAIKQPSDYLTNSYYAYQIRPYLDLFGSDNIYIDTFESFTNDTPAFCARLFRWLDIDDQFVPPGHQEAHNKSPASVPLVDNSHLISRTLKRLRKIEFIRNWTPTRLRLFVARRLPKKGQLSFSSEKFTSEVECTREMLSPLFAHWTRELSEITSSSYEEWPSYNSIAAENEGASVVKDDFWLPKEMMMGLSGSS